jgi:hypothetical protein
VAAVLAQQLDLVTRHVPILWLHRNEAFHPVDAQRMLDRCDVYRKRSSGDVKLPTQPATLDELSRVSRSENCYLELPDLDPVGFRIPDGIQATPAGHPLEGKWVRIEYHYLFVYNDAWNQHQGDWERRPPARFSARTPCGCCARSGPARPDSHGRPTRSGAQ